MTPKELKELRKRYPAEKLAKIRGLFDKDANWWASIKHERDLDMQCISTETDDPTKVAGPWPPAEWESRHAVGNERPCLHEDLLTPYCNQVINKIEMNPMGIEAKPAGDGADEKTAEFRENRIRALEYEENGQFAYQTASKCAVEGSYGWWKAETRYGGKNTPSANMNTDRLTAASYGGFNQKICIIPVMDPNTIVPSFFKKPDASDMRRAWEIERMTHEEFRDKYGKVSRFELSEKSFEFMSREAGAWVDDGTIQVVAWWHLESDERELMEYDDDNVGPVEVYSDEIEDGWQIDESRVLRRRTVQQNKIVKTVMNGLEVFDETEWIDPGDGDDVPPEIPIFGVFGRMKYVDGKLVIESLVRKGRVGQLLYDYCISSIQEEQGQIPKAKAWGPEGVFDTSTPWRTLTRTPVAYAEYAVAYDENGVRLEKPEFVPYMAQLDQLLQSKESIVRGIQNAIGMTSTERKERKDQSGKAITALEQEMSIGTSHYFGALRIAQERFYRMLNRCLPKIETGDREVGQRDKFGKHTVDRLPENAYQGRHSVTVGTGKLYQSLQEKQEELAEQLLSLKDQTLLMAVLPGALRMKGAGDFAEQVAKMIEAMQPPQMQQARQGDDQSTQVMQQNQQMRQQLEALNAHSKALETQVIELEDDLKAKKIESDSRERIADKDNETKIQVAEIQAATKIRIDALAQQVAAIKHISDVLTERFGIQMDAENRTADREHQAGMQDQQLTVQQQQSDADREAAATASQEA